MYCSDLKIKGNEIKILNDVFLIYCKDLKCDEKEIEYFEFEINQEYGFYEIRIKDNRYDLGGEALYRVNVMTYEIVYKKYGE